MDQHEQPKPKPKLCTMWWLQSDYDYVRSEARRRGMKVWAVLAELVEMYRNDLDENRFD